MKRTESTNVIRTGLIASAALTCALTLSACCSHRTEAKTYGYSEPAVVQTPPPPPAQPPENRMVVRHPPGAFGVIQLEAVMPTQVVASKDFNYELRATNLTDAMLTGVIVTDKPATGLKVTSAQPEAESSEGAMVWNIGELKAHETKTIKIAARSDVAGPISNCAAVTYTPGAAGCATVQIIKPEVALTSTQTTDHFSKCDPIPYKVTVKNTGVGPINNMVVRQELPEGLVGPDKRRTVEQNIGTLAQGESKTVTFDLRAEHGGTYNLASSITNAEGLSSATKSTIIVGEPVLQVKVNAPSQEYVNVDVPCEVTITNTGDYPAVNTMMQVSSDLRDTTIVAVESNRSTGGGINQWSLGTIEPKQSRTVHATMRGASTGTVHAAFTASAQCAKQAVANAETQLRGIPALLLEVVDQVDPVRIGSDTVYIITVVNQGSDTATNIKVNCKLEDAVSMTSAQGSTNSDAKAGASTVTFAPLSKLGPGEKAVWRVTVKGQKEADTRFSVSMISDQIDRPVEETESTHIYSGNP